MKLFNFILILNLSFFAVTGQENKDMGRFFGGFETNAQRYLEFENDEDSPEYFRSNNYLQLRL
jgi:hypothetical protein